MVSIYVVSAEGAAGVDIKTILDAVNAAGVVGLFALFVVALARKWVVMGWVYNDAVEREQEWKELALTGTKIAEHFAEKSSGGRRRT